MSTLPGTTCVKKPCNFFCQTLKLSPAKQYIYFQMVTIKGGIRNDYFGMVEQAIAKHMPIFTGREDSEWCLSMFLIYCKYFSFLEIGALPC